MVDCLDICEATQQHQLYFLCAKILEEEKNVSLRRN